MSKPEIFLCCLRYNNVDLIWLLPLSLVHNLFVSSDSLNFGF